MLLARRAGVDVRSAGSGNIGATNVMRAAGWRVGVATLVLDAARGALVPLLARVMGLSLGVACAAGLAVLMGNMFPLFAGFRGGKGVATTLGIVTVLAPDAALAALAVFAVLVRIARIVSVASIAAVVAVPVGLYLFGYPTYFVVAGFAIAAIIVWRHRENIARLRAGTEPRLPR